MPGILYTPQFLAELSSATHDLQDFFGHKIQSASLSEYRRYVRHQDDFDRFQGDLEAIDSGKKTLPALTIGSITLNKKTYILHHGPWRGYLRKEANGTIVALKFQDCR